MADRNWLQGCGLDRRAELRTQPDALRAIWMEPTTRLLVLDEGRTFTRRLEDGRLAPRWFETHELPGLEPEDALFLGFSHQFAVFAVDVSGREPPDWVRLPADELKSADLRRTGPKLTDEDASLWAYGRALTWWHRRHRFCPVCGNASRSVDAGHRRECQSASCGAEQHPRTDAAVIVLVTHGDRCLLARSPRFPAGMYSALAGFVEPGESLEDCVRREVHEEVGLDVDNVRYHGSQPWPFPQSLMVGFHADAKQTTLRLDPVEIEDAFWVDRSALRQPDDARGFTVPPPTAIARRLIEAWLDGAE